MTFKTLEIVEILRNKLSEVIPSFVGSLRFYKTVPEGNFAVIQPVGVEVERPKIGAALVTEEFNVYVFTPAGGKPLVENIRLTQTCANEIINVDFSTEGWTVEGTEVVSIRYDFEDFTEYNLVGSLITVRVRYWSPVDPVWGGEQP